MSEKTVRRLIRRGDLPAVCVGGQVRVDELEDWLDANRVRPEEAA